MRRGMTARRQLMRMRAALGLARIELLGRRRGIVHELRMYARVGMTPANSLLVSMAQRHVTRLDALLASIDLALGQKAGAGVCRVCRCTDDHACEGGCWWVKPDLCSACEVPPSTTIKRAARPGTRRLRDRDTMAVSPPSLSDAGGGP